MLREQTHSSRRASTIGLALGLAVWVIPLARAFPQGARPAAAKSCAPARSPAPEEALRLAVRVKTYEDTAFYQNAAGIIVGDSGGTLRVATAAHVVRDGGKPVDSIEVFFYTHCERAVPARICAMPDPSRDLDLAVLCVPATNQEDRPGSYSRLGNVRRLSPATPVYPVGCPAGECWGVGQPDRILAAGSAQPRILFTTFFVSPGHSGGPLFNEWWEVVGMLTKHGQPLSEAIPIDSVMAVACETGCDGGKNRLRSPFIPRGGYRLSLGFQGLFSAADRAPGGRFPPGRANLMYRINPLVELHAGTIRLIPENLSVTGAVAGVGLNLPPKGRVWGNLFLEGGFARVEGRFDAGGYFVANNGTNVYVPLWRQVKDDGMGFGAGASLMALVLPHTILEITAGHWSFRRPENAPALPDIVWGAGLRLGL